MWYFSPAWLFGLEHSGLTVKEYFRSARSIRYKFIGGKLIEFIKDLVIPSLKMVFNIFYFPFIIEVG